MQTEDLKTNPSNNNTELTREIISNNANIKLTDHSVSDNLSMYCYIQCDNDSNNLIKKARGLIYHNDSLVIKSLGYTDEYTEDDKEIIEKEFSQIKNYKIFESHEGTLLRVYYFNNKWFVSTHRKLDANKSKWACKDSFGILFRRAINSNENLKEKFEGDDIYDQFLDSLNKDCKYLFLLTNNSENRIVCNANGYSQLYGVGIYDNNNEFSLDQGIDIERPKELFFNNVDEVFNYVEENGFDRIQGVIVFSEDKIFKILNKKYKEFFEIRGNEPSIKYRYLQCRMDSDKLNKLYFLYPKYGDSFDEYENLLYDAAKKINFYYIRRFIKKKYITVPKDEYNIMKLCHEWHKENRVENRISIRKVIEILNTQQSSSLNRIIRRAKNSQKQYINYNQEKQRFLRPRTHTSPMIRFNKSSKYDEET